MKNLPTRRIYSIIHNVFLLMFAVTLTMLAWEPTIHAAIVSLPVKWEHGLETPNAKVTFYKNNFIGYNVGVVWKKSQYDYKSDRAEVFDFLSGEGCSVVQGGGEPFSEYLLVCKGVTDHASANTRFVVLLPKLEAFVRQLR